MSLQVYLYGDLNQKNPEWKKDSTSPSKNVVPMNGIKIVHDIMKKFGIEEQEISHIFVNGKYCGPGKAIKDGDRIGIFPKKMGVNFIEISTNNIIPITVKFFANLQKYGPPKTILVIPEGSTVNYLLKKYRIPKDEVVKIMINGQPHMKSSYILKENDTVAIFPLLAGG